MIKLESLTEERPDIDEMFQEVLLEASKKLQFNYFLNENILLKMGKPSHRTSHLRLKFSNKFLPSTLLKTGPRVDNLMRIEMGPEEPMECEAIRKLPKNDTPMSYCS